MNGANINEVPWLVKACFLKKSSFAALFHTSVKIHRFLMIFTAKSAYSSLRAGISTASARLSDASKTVRHARPSQETSPAKPLQPHTQHNTKRIPCHNATAPHPQHRYPHRKSHHRAPLKPDGNTHAAAQIGIKAALSQSRTFTTSFTSCSRV